MSRAWERITDAWFRVWHNDWCALGPVPCVVCGKPLRKGSLIDGLWPYHWENSHHRKCHAAFLKEVAA